MYLGRFRYLGFVSSSKLTVAQEGWQFIVLRNKHMVALLTHSRKKEKKEEERMKASERWLALLVK